MNRADFSGGFFVGGGIGRRKGQSALAVVDNADGVAIIEQVVERAGGLVEALVGIGVSETGVLEMRANSFKTFGELINLFAETGEIGLEALGVFLDLHAAEAHGDHREMGVEGIG